MLSIRSITLLIASMLLSQSWLLPVAFGEISAPTSGEAGKLIVAHSDEPATWTVYPDDYKTSYLVADDGCTLVFASPLKGAVTFIAGTVEDGKTVLHSHTLYNGVTAPNNKDVNPAPVDDNSLEGVVKRGAVGKDAGELEALSNAFDVAIDGINRGTVTTTSGARETFRSAWVRGAASVNPQAINNLSELIADVSKLVDNSTLASLKADYEKIVKTLKESIPAQKPAEEKPEPANNSTCPNCPNGQCQRQWRYY